MDFQTYLKRIKFNKHFYKYQTKEIKRYSENMNSEAVILYDNFIIRKSLRFNRLGMLLYNKELLALKVVKGRKHFPQLINFNPINLDIYMSYCGETINKNNVPKNWLEQINVISRILTEISLDLKDLQKKNICVLNSIIYIIDLADYDINKNMNIKEIYIKLYNLIKYIK